jgi:hypothetical protein
MLIVKHKPWPEIAEFYRSLVDKQPAFYPMQKLVEQIAASKYASNLYASTSMHTLLIAQTAEFDTEKEVLRVSLDVEKGALVLDFQETASRLPKYQHWMRRCSPEERVLPAGGFSQRSGLWSTNFRRLRVDVIFYSPLATSRSACATFSGLPKSRQ